MFYICLQFGVKLFTCLVVLDSVEKDAKRNFCVISLKLHVVTQQQ